MYTFELLSFASKWPNDVTKPHEATLYFTSGIYTDYTVVIYATDIYTPCFETNIDTLHRLCWLQIMC
jgi:hypothetical protein